MASKRQKERMEDLKSQTRENEAEIYVPTLPYSGNFGRHQRWVRGITSARARIIQARTCSSLFDRLHVGASPGWQRIKLRLGQTLRLVVLRYGLPGGQQPRLARTRAAARFSGEAG